MDILMFLLGGFFGVLLCALLSAQRNDEEMTAMMWAQKVLLGRKHYKEVPAAYRAQVGELLRESGCEELMTEETDEGRTYL